LAAIFPFRAPVGQEWSAGRHLQLRQPLVVFNPAALLGTGTNHAVDIFRLVNLLLGSSAHQARDGNIGAHLHDAL
jgi:hypothetical protein